MKADVGDVGLAANSVLGRNLPGRLDGSARRRADGSRTGHISMV
jgi:hypothetical protein